MRGSGIAVSFVKDGKRCLTTSDLVLSLQAVKVLHGQRHQIEEFIKICAVSCGGTISGTPSSAHLHSCLMVNHALETKRPAGKTTIYKLWHGLIRRGGVGAIAAT